MKLEFFDSDSLKSLKTSENFEYVPCIGDDLILVLETEDKIIERSYEVVRRTVLEHSVRIFCEYTYTETIRPKNG